MPVTNYYTVNGGLIGEKTAGGSRTDYLTDALGNVTATVNQSGQVVNTYRYKPYGADPAFRWVGAQGYRQTGKKYSDVYVRARHYDSMTGRWTAKDPLWPRQSAYVYVGGRLTSITDVSGLQFPIWLPMGGNQCPPYTIKVVGPDTTITIMQVVLKSSKINLNPQQQLHLTKNT